MLSETVHTKDTESVRYAWTVKKKKKNSFWDP